MSPETRFWHRKTDPRPVPEFFPYSWTSGGARGAVRVGLEPSAAGPAVGLGFRLGSGGFGGFQGLKTEVPARKNWFSN